jgi:hypothetical protein
MVARRSFCNALCGVVILLAGACSGEDGERGAAGTSGHNSLVTTTSIAAGDLCKAGGVRIDIGLDANDDGVLSSGEITTSQLVCQGSDGADGADATASLTALQRAAVQLGSVFCDALVACQCTDATASADCATAYGEHFLALMTTHLVTYPGQGLDATKLQTCLTDAAAAFAACPASIKVDSCAAFTQDGLDVFTGLQGLGEACVDSIECLAGLACDTTLDTCQPKGTAVGDSCASVECATGLYCSAATLCAQQGIEGSGCDVTESEPCQETLSCLAIGQCAAPHSLGESCTDGAGCVAGTYCSSTCHAAKAGAESCTVGSQCLSASCVGGLCDQASFCRAAALGL